MPLYVLHMIICRKNLNGLLAKSSKTIWPWSAVVCLGPLFPSASHCLVSKEPGGEGKGDYMYTRTHSHSQNTHQQTPPSTIAHHQYHCRSTHHQDVFNPLYMGARSHIQMRQVPRVRRKKRRWHWWRCQPWPKAYFVLDKIFLFSANTCVVVVVV